MPLYRRIPRGALTIGLRKSKGSKREQLNCFDDDTIVTAELLVKAGLIRDNGDKIRSWGKAI